MFGRSGTASASSSVASSTREGACASAACVRSIAISTEAVGGKPSSLPSFSRSWRMLSSAGARPMRRWSSMSLPVHSPAIVARSCVVTLVSASSGKWLGSVGSK